VRLVRNGEAPAFAELVARYLRGALAVALEYAHDRDEAEDIVQESFMRTLTQIERFDTRLSFRPWFYTILRNIGRNTATRRARSAPLTDDLPAAPAADTDVRNIVERELSQMPEMQAASFRLCEIEGFDSNEVGDMLGVAPATVRTHTHRARLKLRAALTRSGYGSPE
jgi:RNA polymerase sigma factor (sigma-70 family)